MVNYVYNLKFCDFINCGPLGKYLNKTKRFCVHDFAVVFPLATFTF